jgi:hypothetical protein
MARRQDRDRPDDTIWRGKILHFKKRWPVEVTRLNPALGAAYERSLKTSDLKEAASRCAAHRVGFDRICRETLAGVTVVEPSGDPQTDWLRSLTVDHRAIAYGSGDG